MTPLRRLPACATTGVGSLPFTDPVEAVAHVRAAYDVPFCPQLPAIDGDMVGEWLSADPRRCGFSEERQRPHPAAWDAFVASLAATPPIHGLVKLQVTGPVTLAFGLGLGRRDPELPGLALDLARWAGVTVARWVAEVAGLGLTAIVMVDEPGLAAVPDLSVVRAWDPIRAVAPVFGMHICGVVPWPLVAAIRPDLLSFDAGRVEHHAHRLPGVIGELRRLGIRAVPGVVDVTQGESPHPIRPEELGATAPVMVTPACGTGLRTPAEERSITTRLRMFATGARAATSPHPDRHGDWRDVGSEGG